MADILSVEQGDQFWSINIATTLEVVKIWFEFSVVDQRWETSVTWDVKHPLNGSYRLSGKGRDFVKTLRDSSFVRMNKKVEESSSNGTTADTDYSLGTLSSPATTNTTSATSLTDPKRKMWEASFRKNATAYGFSPSDLGRRVILGSNRSKFYTIVGARPQNWKMPILIQGKRGGVYKITAAKAKAGLV